MTDILEWLTLCHWGCLMHCSMFLYPYLLLQPKISPDIVRNPLIGQNHPWLWITGLEVEKARILTFPASLAARNHHVTQSSQWNMKGGLLELPSFFILSILTWKAKATAAILQPWDDKHKRETMRVREAAPTKCELMLAITYLWTSPIRVGLITPMHLGHQIEGFYYLQLKAILTVKAHKSVWIFS